MQLLHEERIEALRSPHYLEVKSAARTSSHCHLVDVLCRNRTVPVLLSLIKPAVRAP